MIRRRRPTVGWVVYTISLGALTQTTWWFEAFHQVFCPKPLGVLIQTTWCFKIFHQVICGKAESVRKRGCFVDKTVPWGVVAAFAVFL